MIKEQFLNKNDIKESQCNYNEKTHPIHEIPIKRVFYWIFS